MKLDTWMTFYARICSDFGFEQAADLESAKVLANMLGKDGSESLHSAKGRIADVMLVCGGADVLEDEISSIAVRWPVVASDSATTNLLESGITPDIIVTDLDGVIEDQIDANAGGVPVFIHAHGDNKNAIERYVKRFKGTVVGTCQCAPPPNLFNFGGFTDGDRAACICSELGAKTILLAGFDFENPSDKPGRSRDVKKRKLHWARTILDELGSEGVKVIPVGDYRDR